MCLGLSETHADIWYAYNSIPVFVSSIAIFLIFIDIKIKGERSKRVIIKIAAATLGVYLIHEQTNLRQILWKDILNVDKYYNSYAMMINIIIVVFGIFLGCVLIEWLRIYVIGILGKKRRKVGK